jgi:hypothetical protein
VSAQEYDFIVFDLGIVVRIASFASRMMATSELWPEIRNPTAVTVDQGGGHQQENDAVTTSWLRVPRDPLRQAVVAVFMRECFDFIVRHEYAHLVLGHCKHLKSDCIDYQVLELAADAHAAYWGINRLFRIQGMLGCWHRGGIFDGYRVFHTTPYNAMRNYLLAMYLAFRIFDEPKWNANALASTRHPPAPIRFHAACLQLEEHFKRIGNSEVYDHLLGARAKVWDSGERIFAEALDREPNSNVIRQTMSDESEQHFYRILERSKTLPRHLLALH